MSIKRDVFAELVEGFESLAVERQGTPTLRRFKIDPLPGVELGAGEILSLRERLNVSRRVLALHLLVNEHTLENWEQGRARPNAQAALLLKLVERYPDTLDRLASL